MTAKNKRTAAFVLDDRTIENKLETFRQYSQLLPFTPAKGGPANWAQVILGSEAGRTAAEGHSSPEDGSAGQESFTVTGSQGEPAYAWPSARESLARLYNAPESANGTLPPEQAFLLTLLGLLDTPQALFNQLPARHRALYYQQMLALRPREAQADRLTVHFTLADGSPEQVLPAGLELDAGQDSAGTPLRYALTEPLTVNTARVTDLRWVVKDACVPGGYRARTLLDERAGLAFPANGVRLFEAAPALPGKPLRPDNDRPVLSGRIIESPILAIAGGIRTWTVMSDKALTKHLQAAVSIDNAWVSLIPVINDKRMTLTLGADAGVPSAADDLDGLTSTAPLLRLTDRTGAAVPEVTSLDVTVTGATNIMCADDNGIALTEGGLPFGESAEPGRGVNLMSEAWLRLGNLLKSVTVTPAWAGLPRTSFGSWYGVDPAQKAADWFRLDRDLNVTTGDDEKAKTLDKLKGFGAGTRAGSVTNSESAKTLVKPDSGYGSAVSDSMFTVKAVLVRQGAEPSELAAVLPLFEEKKAVGTDTAPVGKPLTVPVHAGELLLPNPAASVPENEDPATWPWRVRLTLQNSFMQDVYDAHQNAPPQTITLITRETSTYLEPEMIETTDSENVKVKTFKLVRVSIPGESQAAGADKKTTEVMQPAMKEVSVDLDIPVTIQVPKARLNPPYLPQWAGISVDYTAQEPAPAQRVITPFGYAPQNAVQMQPPADAELYLGLEGITAGELLSLHWALRSPGPLELDWQYLMPGEQWARLPLRDDTDGFSRSGNASADWPEDASYTSASMPSGRMWLRGRQKNLAARDPRQMMLPATPWLSGLVTNAATATLLRPQDIQADHFMTPLPAMQVTQALNAPDSVQAEQPWPSSGGQPAETRDAFEARVARRLRHRERALNDHDLKTLLKEKYAGIRELSVLEPARADDGSLTQTLIVMPGPAMSDSDDAHRPALSSWHLNAMADALKSIASPWLQLDCVNPVYIPVSVAWDIVPAPGLSLTTVNARARSALNAVFMPWCEADDDGSRLRIGQPVTHSAVRDILRHVQGVKDVTAVYLNGSASREPPVRPDQVAWVTCVPMEYSRLTLAWVSLPEPDGHTLWSECTVPAGPTPGLVRVTYPLTMTQGGRTMQITSDDIHLIDLDSGRLLNQTSQNGPRAEHADETGSTLHPSAVTVAQMTSATVPNVSGTIYAGPLGSLPANEEGRASILFNVHNETAGVFHLGVSAGMKFKGEPDGTLLSAVVGQRITLNVKQS